LFFINKKLERWEMQKIDIIFIAIVLIMPSMSLAQSSGEVKIWFQHDDYVDINGDSIPEFVPDMLTRWEQPSQWVRALNNMESYSIDEQLFKTDGAPQGKGAKFLQLLRGYFGNLDDHKLHKAYLRLILPVLHSHSVKLHLHTAGSRGDFVPWVMYGSSNGIDTIIFPKDTSGLYRALNVLQLINGVCDSLFNDGYRIKQVKLQSVLSGIWERGLKNNVYCALEYMKAIQQRYPTIEFYLGDALLQRRDHNRRKKWRDAYIALRNTMLNDPRGYTHLNFQGLRIEFDKKWRYPNQFENAQGWFELADSGAFNLIKSFGWQAGLEHNHPFASNEWEYEALVLRTARKSLELNLNWDFAVLHSDEAGGEGIGYPFAVVPENRAPNDPPTFSSVLNRLFDFYNPPTNVMNHFSVPERFGLNQNYPNPFNSSTKISFSIQDNEDKRYNVSLKVYDLLGREIETIVDGYYEAGIHSILYIAHPTFPGGVYFYQVRVVDPSSENVVYLDTKKMVIIK
jgi:hypothetical protein